MFETRAGRFGWARVPGHGIPLLNQKSERVESFMFRINSAEKKAQRVKEVEFSELGLTERYDIQEWVSATPEILQPELPEPRQPGLLMIAKEFSGFDKVRDRVDLLAVDRSGALVVIELKRDDSGEDVHWQAIKYASYFRRARAKKIVKMLAEHENISQEDAGIRLAEHLDEGNLDVLNHRTRIILASHRFAPHVTSAALWLNEAGRAKPVHLRPVHTLPGRGRRRPVPADKHDHSGPRYRII